MGGEALQVADDGRLDGDEPLGLEQRRERRGAVGTRVQRQERRAQRVQPRVVDGARHHEAVGRDERGDVEDAQGRRVEHAIDLALRGAAIVGDAEEAGGQIGLARSDELTGAGGRAAEALRGERLLRIEPGGDEVQPREEVARRRMRIDPRGADADEIAEPAEAVARDDERAAIAELAAALAERHQPRAFVDRARVQKRRHPRQVDARRRHRLGQRGVVVAHDDVDRLAQLARQRGGELARTVEQRRPAVAAADREADRWALARHYFLAVSS